MNKTSIKFYNLIFPIWFLILIPITWIFILPANFFIDLIVVALTMKFMKIKDIKKKVKSVIAKNMDSRICFGLYRCRSYVFCEHN